MRLGTTTRKEELGDAVGVFIVRRGGPWMGALAKSRFTVPVVWKGCSEGQRTVPHWYPGGLTFAHRATEWGRTQGAPRVCGAAGPEPAPPLAGARPWTSHPVGLRLSCDTLRTGCVTVHLPGNTRSEGRAVGLRREQRCEGGPAGRLSKEPAA